MVDDDLIETNLQRLFLTLDVSLFVLALVVMFCDAGSRKISVGDKR